MSQYSVVNESTEDTLATANTFQDAVHLAKKAAREAQPGDLVCILESGGKSVGQFLNLPDGTIQEQPIASQTNSADATHS